MKAHRDHLQKSNNPGGDGHPGWGFAYIHGKLAEKEHTGVLHEGGPLRSL